MKSEDKRATVKLDLTNRDILRFAKRVTGKDYNEFLREYLNAWILCASAYGKFTYVINVHSPTSIQVDFFGKSAMVSGAVKVTDESQVKEIENEMVAQVEKGSFNNVAKKMSNRAKLKKVVD